jgi:hypothetical protein
MRREGNTYLHALPQEMNMQNRQQLFQETVKLGVYQTSEELKAQDNT